MMSSVSEIMESLSSVRSSAWMEEADVVIVETGEGYGGGGGVAGIGGLLVVSSSTC